ncbi:MAG: GFA family protein [Alphaproteobacteria bacterium]|nr:MAG: GFA family protein [Alphaproteobacteria bacterium]
MSTSDKVYHGSCLCGAVAYDVTGPLRDIVYCHCSQCQKSSGHHFAATAAPLENFRLTEDRGLKWYKSSEWADRGFCGTCGANMLWRLKGGERMGILAGSLDDCSDLKAVSHIFVADKKPYYAITDGLPQHPSYPAEMMPEPEGD